MNIIGVALFFLAPDKLLIHSCPLSMGQKYGDYINYPLSHDEIWEKFYHVQYGVDFDYYPRGRIIYNRCKDEYILYYDGCMEQGAKQIASQMSKVNVILRRDEHYQCHMCNPDYVC